MGLDAARRLTLKQIEPLPASEVDLADAVDRIVAEDLYARVDSPSVDASLRDGYAVSSADLAAAGPSQTARLKMDGLAAAGGARQGNLIPGTTMRVLTGASVPRGADAVVPDEDASPNGEMVEFTASVKAGAFILAKGGDVAGGDAVVRAGDRLTPARAGLLTAAGYRHVRVVRRPRVTVVAIGDEIAEPGSLLTDGKLYASNMVSLGAWCRRYGWPVHAAIAADDHAEIERILTDGAARGDALITSGGAWTGDRDLVVAALQRLGWQEVFLTVRIAPGKGVGFGWLQEKPVFVLPGGPPAAMIGFLQIALPSLLRLGGHKELGLPHIEARLKADLSGRDREWTQIVLGRLTTDDSDLPLFDPLPRRRRLVAMADADALVAIPEGVAKLAAGTVVRVQLLN